MQIDYPRAFLEENRLLAAGLQDADWSLPVPTCPDWTLLQLIRHVGRGDRWAAQMVRERADEALDPRAVKEGRPPDDPSGALTWLQEGPQLLLDAVAGIPADTSVWTFLGPQPASWWIRRRLHEAAVHRADAAIAAGQEFVLAPMLAADAISEWLEISAVLQSAVFGSEAAVLLQPSDPVLSGMSWRLADAARAGNGTHDTLARGTSAGLLLALTRRRTAEEAGVVIDGDRSLWDRWLAATPF
jgi:uncharacterized protein (TIGR03083 family)